MVAGLIPEHVVNIVLYVAYGVYGFMGLLMLILGIVYSVDVGAMESSGLWMILLSLLIMVISGVAFYATRQRKWKLLFAIELFNVGLFLVRVNFASTYLGAMRAALTSPLPIVECFACLCSCCTT